MGERPPGGLGKLRVRRAFTLYSVARFRNVTLDQVMA
jgi:hypothetical protein